MLVNMRIKPTQFIGTATGIALFGGGADQGLWRVNGSGQMILSDGLLNQLGIDLVNSLSINTWYTIEFAYLMSDSAGRIECRKDGVQLAALTSIALGGSVSNSIDTKPGVGATMSTLELRGTFLYEIDWLIIKTGTGVWSASDFPGGNIVKKTTRPASGTAGNGNYVTGSAWAIGAGTGALADTVREGANSGRLDGDTSYVVRSATGTDAQDRVNFKHDATPSNVNAVKLVSHKMGVRANPAGAVMGFKPFLYMPSTTTTYDYSGTYSAGSSAYSIVQQNYDVHPDAAVWTKARVDEIQPGLKLMSIV